MTTPFGRHPDYLAQLQEPLLIRGYFSSKTHPLLAPLVPQLRDLLQEYAVAGGARCGSSSSIPTEQPQPEKKRQPLRHPAGAVPDREPLQVLAWSTPISTFW